jgi:hypothetical protein
VAAAGLIHETQRESKGRGVAEWTVGRGGQEQELDNTISERSKEVGVLEEALQNERGEARVLKRLLVRPVLGGVSNWGAWGGSGAFGEDRHSSLSHSALSELPRPHSLTIWLMQVEKMGYLTKLRAPKAVALSPERGAAGAESREERFFFRLELADLLAPFTAESSSSQFVQLQKTFEIE